MPSIDVTAGVEKASGNTKPQLFRWSALQTTMIWILRATDALRRWMDKRFDIAIDQDKTQFMPKCDSGTRKGTPLRVVFVEIDTYYLGSFIRA